MKTLFLADLSGCQTQIEVKEAIACQFEIEMEDLERFAVLIGYISVGDYGCDSSAYILLREHKTGKYYEVFGSHCSCYGFEDQWEPEETTIEYLTSNHFGFGTGGYDYESKQNEMDVKAFMQSL